MYVQCNVRGQYVGKTVVECRLDIRSMALISLPWNLPEVGSIHTPPLRPSEFVSSFFPYAIVEKCQFRRGYGPQRGNKVDSSSFFLLVTM